MSTSSTRRGVAVALLAVAVVLSGAAAAGAVPAAAVGSAGSSGSASPHGAEYGNYTVDLPFDTDHYPRDENPGGPANASINHFAAFNREIFEQQGVEKGVDTLDFIIISSDDIDFSECKTENTAAFGIDRDNDDAGTTTDVGLLSYRKNSEFNPHSIVVEFYDEGAFAAPSREDKGGPGENPGERGEGREDGDPAAEVYPDDEIVAHQGYRSGGGACYKMPKEPGWYQIDAFGNGTAFNGNDVVTEMPSHYFYICECDSRQQAVEQLGPPPSQEGESSGGATPTPTATPTPDGSESSGGATPTPTATPTLTATPAPTATATPSGNGGGGGSGGGGSTATASPSGNGGSGGGNGGGGSGNGGSTATATRSGGSGNSSGSGSGSGNGGGGSGQPETPTAAQGPGFGAVLALGALLGAALLARRREP